MTNRHSSPADTTVSASTAMSLSPEDLIAFICQRFCRPPSVEALVLIPNPKLAAEADAMARTDYPRVMHWQPPQPSERLHEIGFVRHEVVQDDRYGGSRLIRRFRRTLHTPLYTSFLFIAPGGLRAIYSRIEKLVLMRTVIVAPRGYFWTDEGVLKRVLDRECYKPTLEDLEEAPLDLGERATKEIQRRCWVRDHVPPSPDAPKPPTPEKGPRPADSGWF